jgi:hypothetical protein
LRIIGPLHEYARIEATSSTDRGVLRSRQPNQGRDFREYQFDSVDYFASGFGRNLKVRHLGGSALATFGMPMGTRSVPRASGLVQTALEEVVEACDTASDPYCYPLCHDDVKDPSIFQLEALHRIN